MSQSIDSIMDYIALLHANKDLIAAAYCNGGVILDPDNQRRIRQLQQYRVMLPYFQNEFRLSLSLGRHLDEAFQRQRSYAVGANFGDLINRLSQLIVEYVNAVHENRLDDHDDYAMEFDVGVFELASLVTNELLTLRVITENQFSNVTTLAEKQRQNEFYLDRAEKIGEAIALLDGENLVGTLRGSSILEPLFEVYRHQIMTRLQEWRATHLDITAVLKAFLYRLRHVEPNAQRIRAFAHFLRKTPDYQPPDVDSISHLPAWSARYSGLRLKIHPDLSSSRVREALADTAKAIPAAKINVVKPREAGRLLDPGTEKAVNHIQPKQVQVAFHRYLQSASLAGSPLSAIAWKRQQAEFSTLDDSAWLLYVIHALQMLSNARLRRFEMVRHELPSAHQRSGNIVVTDMALWTKL